MSFLATTGAKMVSTRSLQLTVKKTARTVKSLEGQLLMIKEGERTSISSRVAELDHLMPQYLGVSKAVLDSVIFCHQDESLWPLSEPSKLKDRFDAIFEAMKYTKAIDNIKVMKKKQSEELAKFKIIEQHAKEDKNAHDAQDGDYAPVFDMAKALMTIQRAYGLIPKIVGKGDAARVRILARYSHIAPSPVHSVWPILCFACEGSCRVRAPLAQA